MRLSVLRGGSRKSERGAGLGLSGGGAAPFSPVSISTASVKLLPKNSMTKSMGPPPLLWLCLYHLFPRIVRLSCRFQRYSCPARVSCSPSPCRKETRSAWLARSILFLGVIHKSSTPFSGLYRAAWCGSASAPAGRRGVQYPRICGFFEARQPRRGSLSACHIPLPSVF